MSERRYVEINVLGLPLQEALLALGDTLNKLELGWEYGEIRRPDATVIVFRDVDTDAEFTAHLEALRARLGGAELAAEIENPG